MFPWVQKLVGGNDTRTALERPGPSWEPALSGHFPGTAGTIAAAKIVDTRYTEISSDLSDLDTNSLAVEQAGFGEYISVCACFSVKLTTVLFFGMTLVGFAVPVATVDLVFLAVRSECLSLLAPRPEFLTP